MSPQANSALTTAVPSCVERVARRAHLTPAQALSVYSTLVADARAHDWRASDDDYRRACTDLQPLHAPATDEPHPAEKYAFAVWEDRAILAAAHIEGMLDRISRYTGEAFDTIVTRYHRFRALAELDASLTVPSQFTDSLASGAFTWAIPRDRVTTWGLWKTHQAAATLDLT